MAKKIILMLSLLLTLTGCRRDPDLNLHRGGTKSEVEIESINFELETYWDYEFEYGIEYDWQAEWSYGWDDEDTKLFGGELNKFEANNGFVIRGYNKRESLIRIFSLHQFYKRKSCFFRIDNIDTV